MSAFTDKMTVTNYNEKKTQMELVFAITIHPVLGYLIEPYAVGRTPKNQFEYGFKKVVKKTFWDYFDELPDELVELMELLHKIEDDNLHKRFNPSAIRISKFYDTLKPEYISMHVRPFIEKVLYTAANFMAEKGIPLYFKGEVTERIKEKPIIIQPELAETCFNFERLPDQTNYRLEVRYGGKDLFLYMKNAALITQQPCLLLLGKNLLRFDPDWDGKKLQPFFTKEYLEVPKASEKQFYQKFVQKSILNYPYKASGFEINLIDGLPQSVLRLEEHWQGGVVLGLYFRYADGSIFRQDDPVKNKIQFKGKDNDIAFDKVSRNTEFEKGITASLQNLGLQKIDGPFLSLFEAAGYAMQKQDYTVEKQIDLTIDWFNKNHETLLSKGFICEKSIFNKKYHSGIYTIQLKTFQKNDWFDVYGTVKFGDFEVPFSDLYDNILKENREYKLPDGSIALIPLEWMSKFHDIVKFSHKKGKTLQVKKFHYSLLAAINDGGLKLPGFEMKPEDEKYEVPSSLNASLRSYQLDGYNWMMFLKKNNLGGCLADDMGLGKTLQALAILAHTHLTEETLTASDTSLPKPASVNKPGQMNIFEQQVGADGDMEKSAGNASLIIMPLSLIHNWREEISRFVPSLKVVQHTGPSRAADIMAYRGYDLILTTYGTVRNDIDMLEKYLFRYVVLDESQIIKNATSRSFSAIRKLQAQHRLVLTGTPVENSLSDMWSQFSFANPGMLGSLNFFKNEFVVPIEKKNDEIISRKLQNIIQPFILRRTKNQVAKELPPLTEIIHYCEMTPEQEAYYEEKKSQIRNAILENVHDKGPDKSRFYILSGLTKLRLIANHPGIIDKDYSYESGKYIEVQRNIEKLMDENHKVLIFSQFVKHLNLFGNEFQRQNIPFNLLTGKVLEKDREQVIGSFQKDEMIRLFLISLKAGGVGLNLTEADYVFMLDPWWNPAVEKQAINRAHRIGQDKNVFVYKFITRNTVEEKILKLQQRKSDLAGMFINDNNPLKSLTFEELTELI